MRNSCYYLTLVLWEKFLGHPKHQRTKKGVLKAVLEREGAKVMFPYDWVNADFMRGTAAAPASSIPTTATIAAA